MAVTNTSSTRTIIPAATVPSCTCCTGCGVIGGASGPAGGASGPAGPSVVRASAARASGRGGASGVSSPLPPEEQARAKEQSRGGAWSLVMGRTFPESAGRGSAARARRSQRQEERDQVVHVLAGELRGAAVGVDHAVALVAAGLAGGERRVARRQERVGEGVRAAVVVEARRAVPEPAQLRHAEVDPLGPLLGGADAADGEGGAEALGDGVGDRAVGGQ